MRWKKYRHDDDHSYTFGFFPTIELLHHRPQQAREVLLTADSQRSSGFDEIQARCRELDIPLTIDDKSVDRLSSKGNTFAVGVFTKYRPSLDSHANHLVLVNPADMGNLGTILRTMLGFGVRDLALVRPAADIFDPRTIRASMGALFQTRFAYFDSFGEYASAFSRAFYPLMTDGVTELRDAEFRRPFSLIFGSERAGLPPEFHSVGTSLSIPQQPAIDSLNLPVAVGIALYEATKGSRGAGEQESRGAEEQRGRGE